MPETTSHGDRPEDRVHRDIGRGEGVGQRLDREADVLPDRLLGAERDVVRLAPRAAQGGDVTGTENPSFISPSLARAPDG